MSVARAVEVEFVDASTGHVFARSEIPVEQLPATFDVDSTLTLAGDSWSVVRAEPPTATEFRAIGRLVLMLSRVRSVPPRDMLYSLPTLCDALPPVDPAHTAANLLQLHEDDWRQVELVSANFADVVATELAAIQQVYDAHTVTGAQGGLVGFRDLHVRVHPQAPLIPPLPQAAIRQLLPTQRSFAGVGFLDGAGTAVGSFAFGCGPFNVYGLAAGDTVTVLGLQLGRARFNAANGTAAGLEGVMRAFALTLVDWCRCTVVDADSVGAYVQSVR
jgi:hypothetical protein